MPCPVIIPAYGNSTRWGPDGSPKGMAKIQLTDFHVSGTMVELAAQRPGGATVVCKPAHESLFKHSNLPTHALQTQSSGQSETIAHYIRETKNQNNWQQPFIVVNCDNAFQYDFRVFERVCKEFRAGALVFEEEDNDSLGYVDAFPIFDECVEKQPISPYALAGAFYFSSYAVFYEAYVNQKAKAVTPGYGECYISGLMEFIGPDKLAVLIPRDTFYHWTSPDHVEAQGGKLC